MDSNIKNKLSEVALLCKKHKVKSAYIFGSVLTENFNPSSDIDLLVYFQKVPFKGYADNLFSLEESLTKLLGRKVDLVPGHTLSNPYFIASVNRNKVALYE
jgi:predicted nucleotidyltransferase